MRTTGVRIIIFTTIIKWNILFLLRKLKNYSIIVFIEIVSKKENTISTWNMWFDGKKKNEEEMTMTLTTEDAEDEDSINNNEQNKLKCVCVF